MERTRSQQTLDVHMGIPFENVTFTALGKKRKLFRDILDEGIYIYIYLLNITSSRQWVVGTHHAMK